MLFLILINRTSNGIEVPLNNVNVLKTIWLYKNPLKVIIHGWRNDPIYIDKMKEGN